MKFVSKAKLPVMLGVISISCPFIVAVIIALVHLSHSAFWTEVSGAPQDDANRNAAAMMGVAEGIIGIFASLAGCIAGTFLGLVSFSSEKKGGSRACRVDT